MAGKKSRSKTEPGLRVIGPRGGFRRVGHAFGPDATDIPLRLLSEEDIATLKAEAKLIVSEIEIPLVEA